MINQKVIDRFLQIKVDDWLWLKDVPVNLLLKELEVILEENKIIDKLDIKTIPWQHQAASILLGLNIPNFLFFLDMGLGKTFISIYIAKIRQLLNQVNKTLVVVPNEVSTDSWCREISKHSNMTYSQLIGSKEDRYLALEKEVDFYLINYPGLQSLLTSKQEVRNRKGIVHNERKQDNQKIHEFAKKFDMLILDEIHHCKNHQSLTYKLCNEMSKFIPYRYGLTGTPFGKTPLPLWPQFYIIDKGESLGRNITLFRESFFEIKEGYWGGFDYKFKRELEDVLAKKIGNRSIRYSEEEVVGLPPKVYQTVYLEMSKEAKVYYNNIVEGIDFGNINTTKNNFMKLWEICNGFLYYNDQDTEERNILKFESNLKKLEPLEEMVLGIPEDSKFIILHEFTESGKIIQDLMKKLKVPCLRLYSGTKDKINTIKEFLEVKNIRGLIANSGSIAESINLQEVCNYAFYYESPCSPIIRKQSEKRIHRKGQEKKTFFYDFVMRGTIEEKILSFLSDGKDLFECLIDRGIKIDKI